MMNRFCFSEAAISIQGKIIFIFILVLIPLISYAQEEMSKEMWQAYHDKYAVDIILLLTRFDTLAAEIDSLKKIDNLKGSDLEQKEDELYSLVGKTRTEMDDFKKKFDITEKKINSRYGSPADVRSMYFDEISDDRALCLPEFTQRYISMRKELSEWEGKPLFTMPAINPEGEYYTVVQGDCLYSISREKYGSMYFWSLIWDANKNGVVNASNFKDPNLRVITDPNHIYPGQVLFLPPPSESLLKEIQNSLQKF